MVQFKQFSRVQSYAHTVFDEPYRFLKESKIKITAQKKMPFLFLEGPFQQNLFTQSSFIDWNILLLDFDSGHEALRLFYVISILRFG